jgi:hypothetical protein
MCDFTTTQISSKYVDEHHTDHGEKGTGGSRPTHGELLEVVDHSWCRKMYVVLSLERSPWKKRHHMKEMKKTASSHGDAP